MQVTFPLVHHELWYLWHSHYHTIKYYSARCSHYRAVVDVQADLVARVGQTSDGAE